MAEFLELEKKLRIVPTLRGFCKCVDAVEDKALTYNAGYYLLEFDYVEQFVHVTLYPVGNGEIAQEEYSPATITLTANGATPPENTLPSPVHLARLALNGLCPLHQRFEVPYPIENVAIVGYFPTIATSYGIPPEFYPACVARSASDDRAGADVVLTGFSRTLPSCWRFCVVGR